VYRGGQEAGNAVAEHGLIRVSCLPGSDGSLTLAGMAAYVNIHGRRPGRGIRPWLLGPKVLSVGVYLGGLVSATVLWVMACWRVDVGDGPSVELLEALRLLFLCVVVPGLIGAMVFGIALFFQHPRQFVRLRWWQVKISLVAVMAPTAHWFMSDRLAMVRGAAESGVYDQSAMRQFGWGLVFLLAGSVMIVLLGRLKPRLGQNWAKTYAKINAGKARV